MKHLPKDFVNSFADKLPPWGPVGYITYKRTYARLIEKLGRTEEWHEHCARLVNGLVDLGAPYEREELFELYEMLFYMKGSVSGRAHWQLGTRTVREVGADSLQNCFAGETEFITDEGVKRLDECVGQSVTVWTRDGWRKGTVHEFGVQQLYEVRTHRNSYLATYNHEWIVDGSRVITADLEGKRLPLNPVGESEPDRTEKVLSVTRTEREEVVYCVSVPDVHEFTLANGTLTGNCWTTSCNDLEAFCFAFNELMLGGGVGYNIQAEYVYELPPVRYKPVVQQVDTPDCDFVVPDNRDGWVQLLRTVLTSFFRTGRPVRYSTQLIRHKGMPIKGFGGVASGAGALIDGIEKITKILQAAHRRKLRPIDCLDIMNIIGSVVVAGNVRRSAQIALGDPSDREYLAAKNWGSASIPSWRAMSNNSIVTPNIDNLTEDFWSGYNGSGEPYGLINLEACRKYGRLVDGPDYRPDPDVVGVNPCAEITLCDREACNLAEIYLPNIQTIKEFKNVARLLYIACKTISRVRFSDPISEAISQKNHRIGIGLTGWMAAPKWRDGEKLDQVYRHLEACDKHYSKLMGLNESIKLTCVKPSGCRPPLELTTTDRGFLRVNEIVDTALEGWNPVEGLSVLHGDQERRVTKSFNNGTSSVFEISLSYGMSLRSTKDHPWFVTHRKSSTVYTAFGEWVKTQDLRENDLIGFQSLTLKNNVEFVDIDQESLLRRVDSVRINQPKTMSPDLAWLIGHWFGDGCLSPHKFRFRIVDQYVEHLEKAQRILRDVFGVEANIRPCDDGRNAFELSVGCKSLYHWWQLNVCSNKADGVPLCIRQSDNESILAFFAGMIDSDGCVSGDKVILTQKDGEFLRELQHMLLTCGIVIGRSHNTKGQNMQDVKSMYLSALGLASDPESVSVVTKHSVKAADYVLPQAVRNPVRVGRVKSVDYIGQQPTYDIEVDTDHWYHNGAFKSHNTLSLLPDNCPSGVHAAFGRHIIRRIRFSTNDPLVDVCRAHGYPVEPQYNLDGTQSHDTMVVSFPLSYGPNTITEDKITVFDQLRHQLFLQTHWADNSVSATHYFRPNELDGIKQWLDENYVESVKTASFLPALDHGFAQAPLEKISKEEFNKLVAKTRRITSVTDEGGHEIGGTECEGGHCPVK